MTDSRLTDVDEDVVFDDVTADDLVAAFNGTAEAIEGQATSRATYGCYSRCFSPSDS